MGTAPPSKPLDTPAKPFSRTQARGSCLTHALIPKTRQGPSVILQLIGRRDWQKVLIRATLFPAEISQRQKMSWYGVQWDLLPIHLACALQPPPQVVAMLLHYSSNTAKQQMSRRHHLTKRRRRPRWRLQSKKGKAQAQRGGYTLQPSNQGVHLNDTAPSSDEGEHDVVKEQHNTSTSQDDVVDNVRDGMRPRPSFDETLEDSAFALQGERDLHVFETSEGHDSESDISMDDHDELTAESPKQSIQNMLGRRGLVLQLSANGRLESFSVGKNPGSGMEWNLGPLLMEADDLLPLHVACLFRASPLVVAKLLQTYPLAARQTAMGMLPIHMVCAGFDLPAPVEAPPMPVPFPVEDEWDVAESLKYLVKEYPESLHWPSENNGMTPQMYIEETMDDGGYKDKCLRILGVDVSRNEHINRDIVRAGLESDLSESYDGTSSGTYSKSTVVPSTVQWDDSSTIPSYESDHKTSPSVVHPESQVTTSNGTPLYARMAMQDWDAALDIIEEHPDQCSEWQYGIELDPVESDSEPQLWKRLPIHSACVHHAPIGVVDALHLAHPTGVRTVDPYTGALPLHLACRHSAPSSLVRAVLGAYPVGACAGDGLGRLALHMACLASSSRLTFIYLLQAYPHAVLAKDNKHRTPLQYAKANPTLKHETVELLEMVRHFIERHPTNVKDYKFAGFGSSRRVQQVHGRDDESPGFFEPSDSVVVGNAPAAKDDDVLTAVSAEEKFEHQMPDDNDYDESVELPAGDEDDQQSESLRSADGDLEKTDEVQLDKLAKLKGPAPETSEEQTDSVDCLDGVPQEDSSGDSLDQVAPSVASPTEKSGEQDHDEDDVTDKSAGKEEDGDEDGDKDASDSTSKMSLAAYMQLGKGRGTPPVERHDDGSGIYGMPLSPIAEVSNEDEDGVYDMHSEGDEQAVVPARNAAYYELLEDDDTSMQSSADSVDLDACREEPLEDDDDSDGFVSYELSAMTNSGELIESSSDDDRTGGTNSRENSFSSLDDSVTASDSASSLDEKVGPYEDSDFSSSFDDSQEALLAASESTPSPVESVQEDSDNVFVPYDLSSASAEDEHSANDSAKKTPLSDESAEAVEAINPNRPSYQPAVYIGDEKKEVAPWESGGLSDANVASFHEENSADESGYSSPLESETQTSLSFASPTDSSLGGETQSESVGSKTSEQMKESDPDTPVIQARDDNLRITPEVSPVREDNRECRYVNDDVIPIALCAE